MIEVIHVKSIEEIQEQRECYISELPFAQDLNIEENIWISQYYKINMNSIWVGYFCVDVEKTLWEFYLTKSVLVHSQEIFKYLIDMKYISAAECKTYDQLLISLCFDFYKEAFCSAYLFRDNIDVKFSLNEFDNISIKLATNDDYKSLSEINCIEPGVEFFHNLEGEIRKNEVLIFSLRNELLGAGTCKKIWHSMNYYDIGMVVSEKSRRKGIGTFILTKLKEYCYDNGNIPVAGCYYFNYPSKRTLEKAGFIARHRVIKFRF